MFYGKKITYSHTHTYIHTYINTHKHREIRSRHAEIGVLSGATQAGARTRWNVYGDEVYDREQRVSVQVEE